jgi:hypothetical protein
MKMEYRETIHNNKYFYIILVENEIYIKSKRKYITNKCLEVYKNSDNDEYLFTIPFSDEHNLEVYTDSKETFMFRSDEISLVYVFPQTILFSHKNGLSGIINLNRLF